MDTAGARALAQRIAEGKPPAVTFREPRRRLAPSPKKAAKGVVYIRPLALRTARHVRIYVRGLDGRLRRAR